MYLTNYTVAIATYIYIVACLTINIATLLTLLFIAGTEQPIPNYKNRYLGINRLIFLDNIARFTLNRPHTGYEWPISLGRDKCYHELCS